MTVNINPATQIAYGYISAQALDDDLVQELQFGSQAKDVYYQEAKIEERKRLARDEEVQQAAAESAGRAFGMLDDDDRYRGALQYINETWEGSAWEQAFNDNYQPDEPVHEGEIVIPQQGNHAEGWVKYRTSWLGGALHVWIFDSPHVTQQARRASPCVPNAGILDTLDGDVLAYDVPADWRREQVEYCHYYHCPGDCGKEH